MSESICNCGNEGNVFHEIDCPVMFGAEPVNPKPSMKDPAATAFPAPTLEVPEAMPSPGVDFLGDLRVIAANSFFPPEGGELAVQKKKNGDVSFIFVERESAGIVREHRATMAPGIQIKLMNLLHAPVDGKPENPPADPAPSYDMSIHSNPDAREWARFFVKTVFEVARRNVGTCEPGRIAEETSKIVNDESYMVGWFANAMMAMHDHLLSKQHKEAVRQAAITAARLFHPLEPGEVLCEGDQIATPSGWIGIDTSSIGAKLCLHERARRPVSAQQSASDMFDGLTDDDFDREPESGDWQIPGWMWALFIAGVLLVCFTVVALVKKGAL